MTSNRDQFNEIPSTSHQVEADALQNRRNVASLAMYGRQNTVVKQEDINRYNCSESCKICVARGCWGIFPCFSKKSKHIIYEYQRFIVLRFGRNAKSYGPGYVELLDEPNIDKIHGKIDIRETCYEIPAQTVTSKDMIDLEIVGICFYEIYDPAKGVLQIKEGDVDGFTRQLAKDILKGAIESHTLQEIMEQKQELQKMMRADFEKSMIRYGVRVTRIEIKNLRLVSDQFFETFVRQPTMLRL